MLSERVDDALTEITSLGLTELQGQRFIMLAWDRLPTHSVLLEEVIDRLADAAFSLWPEWYASGSRRAQRGLAADSGESPIESTDLKGSVLPRWLTLAENAVQGGLRPRFKREFTAEVEVRQLGLALGLQSAQLVLAVRDSSPEPAMLAGLARTTEWLLREAKMPILIIVPHPVGSASELDSISFHTVNHQRLSSWDPAGLPKSGATSASTASLPASPHPVGRDESGFDHGVSDEDPSRLVRSISECLPGGVTQVRNRSTLYIHPLIGRPHPDSRGEQLLWCWLTSDDKLRDLFECNVWVETGGGTYLVDFVWRGGKVVVEIDGYYWHSSRFQFSFDRRRDYELLISGYRVMRIPHDELLSNPSLALEKIRRLVQLNQSEGD